MTIPISAKSGVKINEVELPSGKWRKNHLKTIRYSYSPAKYMQDALGIMEKNLNDDSKKMLSELNKGLIIDISEYLGIETEFVDASDLSPEGDRVERLIDICKKVGADEYLSGPSAKSYFSDEFSDTGINIRWMEYGPYREYSQLSEPFDHDVSVIDLISHTGPKAPDFIFR